MANKSKFLALAMVMVWQVAQAQGSTVSTVPVKVVYPEGTSKIVFYNPPAKAQKAWKIGVILPTQSDPYWLAAHYGLAREAKRLGIKIKILSAKGYTDIAGQNAQVKSLINDGMDALIASPISFKDQNTILESVIDRGVPVVGLLNPISSEKVITKRLVSYSDLAAESAKFIVNDANGKAASVVLLPGPKGSGWAEQSVSGFKSVADGRITVEEVLFGDTKSNIQSDLIKQALQKHPKMKYLVGNAVAAAAAVDVLKAAGRSDIKIVSTYATPAVVKGVSNKTVAMVPTDFTALMGSLAVDAAVDLLEKRSTPAKMGPVIGNITAKNIDTFHWDDMFSPDDYKLPATQDWINP